MTASFRPWNTLPHTFIIGAQPCAFKSIWSNRQS
jgi:hypothetical protein